MAAVCCGAPPHPTPTSKYVGRHRQRRVEGISVWPCAAALACERLDRETRRWKKRREVEELREQVEYWKERALQAEHHLEAHRQTTGRLAYWKERALKAEGGG